MMADLSQYYESMIIKDRLWFVCKFNDCDDCEVTEEDIILHIRDHFLSDNDRSDNEVITAESHNDYSEDPPDVKPKIEVICQPTVHTSNASQESEDSYINGIESNIQSSNGFKCHFSGCGKTFLYLKSLRLHKQDHKTKPKAIAKPQIMKTLTHPNLKPQTKAQPKQASNMNLSFNYNHIREKYLRVQRLNDRSIHRWQKQDHRSDANYAGMQSLKNLSEFYRKDIIENEKYYLCEYTQSCLFRTKRSQHMARHLNCCHFRTRIFRCSIRGCDKKYYNPTSLRQHTLNHRCGFGILNGKTMTTMCGNKSINRFRKRIIENDLKIYKCDFYDCPFKTKSHTCIKRHIHDQHLCPNRVKYLDEELAPQMLPSMDQMPHNSGISQNKALSQTIGIPEMMEMPQIRRVSPNKRKQVNKGWEIIPIPELVPMPQISGIPEMIEIPVAPELLNFRDMPSLKMEIKEEPTEQSNSYVHEEIDRLIGGHNYITNQSNLRTNINANEDSDESADEIQIVDEVAGRQRTVSPEFQHLIAEKNLSLDFSQKSFDKCKTELEKLNRCRAHFDIKRLENVGLRYICKCCQFPAKSLESISMHLRLKHFIDN